MSIPQHGEHCRTLTFRTKCKRCGDEVFFFSCTCGSKVFFDKLGPPWHEHDCKFSLSDRQWARSRPRTTQADGSLIVEISKGIVAARRPEKIWNINRKVVETVGQEIKSRQSHPIESVPPGADWEIKIIGVVRELSKNEDVYQRMKLPRTSVSQGFLGDLGLGKWGKITIHEPKSVIYSYTAWALMSELLLEGLKERVTVSATLERFDVPKKARVWICRSLCLV